MQAPGNDYIRLSYRADLHVLFMRWTRVATSEEHRAGYQSALALARREQVGSWLIDLRSRGLADVADLHWVLQEFRSEFQTALPAAVRRIAYLVTPYHAEILRPRLDELNSLPIMGTEIRVFTEELPAQQWLQNTA